MSGAQRKADELMETKVYRCTGNEGINIQGMFRYCLTCNRNTFEDSAMDEAAKLWILADLLPEVPASTLLRIIQALPIFGNTPLVRSNIKTREWFFRTRDEDITVEWLPKDKLYITVGPRTGGEE